MKRPLFFVPLSMIALGLVAPYLAAVDLRADDPVPPVPPGKSLPPPAPPTPTPAPSSTSPKRQQSPGLKSEGDHNNRLEKLTTELKLTAGQVKKIRPIFDNAAQQMKALRNGVSMSATQKRQQIRQILISCYQQIRPILTSQQLQKWKQIRDQRSTSATKT